MNQSSKFKVGTRGSDLAVAQTMLVLGALRKANPGVSFEIRTIKTSGDEGKLEVVGAFVKEVENELREGKIDFAIHSYKDLPVSLPDGLEIASIPKRADVSDCLIARDGNRLKDLPPNAKIGTSSLRRIYQLQRMREDLDIVPVHGNIISRMRKVWEGELDAVVLATAGLQRLDMQEKATQTFNIGDILPAVGQGALGIEVRSDDSWTKALVNSINHPDTYAAVTAEKAFLEAIGGGCRLPMAAFAYIMGDKLLMEGMFCSEDGVRMERANLTGKIESPEKTGKLLAQNLLASFEFSE
jgi:hydroxymethylbilane synthase